MTRPRSLGSKRARRKQPDELDELFPSLAGRRARPPPAPRSRASPERAPLPARAATVLCECAHCLVLVHHAPGEPYRCPQCGGRLERAGHRVTERNAIHVYGEAAATPDEPEGLRMADMRAPAASSAARFACADGHKVRSKEERVIDDWLHANGVPHQLEPKLKGMRPDWRVGEVYIEYWGLAGQQGYEARREEKLALYRERGLRLLELFPEDLQDLGAKLGVLLGAGDDRARLC